MDFGTGTAVNLEREVLAVGRDGHEAVVIWWYVQRTGVTIGSHQDQRLQGVVGRHEGKLRDTAS